MKKLAILVLLAYTAMATFAQDDYQNNEIRTVFSNHRSNGAYGAFTMGYSQIDGMDAFISGARGGFIFDHVLAIGLGGYGFVNNINYYNESPVGELSLAGGYGGIFIEPILAWNTPVHISLPVLFGMGGVAAYENYGWNSWEAYHHYPSYDLGHQIFFVVEPVVEVEFNLARFFRLAAGVSYRHTSKIEITDISPDALRGLNYSLTFKFGKF